MNLKTKLLALLILTSTFLIVSSGGILYNWLRNGELTRIEESVSRQLENFDFSLKNFFREVEGDVTALTENELVRDKKDAEFTNFLQADENTFKYDYSDREKKIIRLFNAHRLAHPNVNSVYMGRENGSFVRSHPREKPTRYDPRERTWYILGKSKKGEVAKTEAYPSVTAKDINIGVVKALTDETGTVYGVLGIDVTIDNLAKYILNFKIRPAGKILITDANGVILAAQREELQGKEVGAYSPLIRETINKRGAGLERIEINGEKNFLFFQKFAEQNWKIAVLVPAADIEKEIREAVIWPMGSLAIGLTLMCALIIYGVRFLVIRPLGKFSKETAFIAKTGNLDGRIDIESSDEIGDLANSYNAMISALKRSRKELEEKENDLLTYKDHLEELVDTRTKELKSTLDDLASAKERAESADRIKSAFLATMSHELRTPLNSIIGFTGIMLQGLAGPLNDEQKKQMGMVQNSSRHLLSLINDVLDISKIEAGQLDLNEEPFDVLPSAEKTIKLVEHVAVQKGLEVRLEFDKDVGALIADKRRVEQIMLNLFNNAVKFTEKGSIIVSLKNENGDFLMSVADTGIGMSPEELPGLFKPFHQIDSGLTRKYEGTGLGLSICKKLLDMMGGSISAESQLGKGSVFFVRIPRKKGA